MQNTILYILIAIIIFSFCLVSCTPKVITITSEIEVDEEYNENSYEFDSTQSKEDKKMTNASSQQKPMGTITLSEYTEPVDLTPVVIRNFVDSAQNYDTTDTKATLTNRGIQDFGITNNAVELMWKYNNISDPQEVNVKISKTKDFANSIERKVPVNMRRVSVKNLETGATYYWKVTVLLQDKKEIESEIGTFSTKEGVRTLTIDGLFNTRDVGGWKTLDGKTVKEGLLYRCATPEKISAAGREVILFDLKIKTQLDFRYDDEIRIRNNDVIPQKSHFGDSIRYIHCPLTYPNSAMGDDAKFSVYEAFNILADYSNYPIIYHCISGADRTGLASILIKGLCGVSENNLIADYEITPDRNRSIIYDVFLTEFKEKVEGDTIDQKVKNYLRNCNVSEMQISNVYNIMLTDSAIFKTDSLQTKTLSSGEILKLNINLRNSQDVTSVTVAGGKAEYSFNKHNGELTLKVDGDKNQTGTINFNDGAVLNFNVFVDG